MINIRIFLTRFFFAAVVYIALQTPAFGQLPVPGEVVDVIDGKTVVVSTSAGRITLELQYIDVPPAEAPMHASIKKHLRELVMGKQVVYRAKTLSFDSTVGQLIYNGIDISQQMLRDGAAWHMPAELSGQDRAASKAYDSYEAAAKAEKRGLWATELKPAWTMTDEDLAKRIVPKNEALSPEVKGSGGWGDKNPRLGDVGALLHGYSAPSRSGWVSTSMIPVDEITGTHLDIRMALEITYFYKELPQGRRGTFVITLVADSSKPRFQTNNVLMMVDESGMSRLAVPKRTVSRENGGYRERLRYEVKREAISRMVNTPMYLKFGEHQIFVFWGKYLLYHMLAVSER